MHSLLRAPLFLVRVVRFVLVLPYMLRTVAAGAVQNPFIVD
jgi:hypothetical protein